MQLHKIRQYSLGELLGILLYRIVYELSCLLDKIRVNLFHSSYKKYVKFNLDNERICELLSRYSQYIREDKSRIINEANRIKKGKIVIFDNEFIFNCCEDWLKDPVSGNLWPSHLFWRDARFAQAGCEDVKYVLEINKMNHLTIVALAYYITGDEEYVLHIQKEIIGWIKCVPRERSVANKIVMDLGFRVINLVQVCILCSKSSFFVENVYPIILGILSQHSNQIWGYLCSRWFKSGNDNNHNVGELVGAYVAQQWLDVCGIKTSHRIIRSEIRYLTEVLDKLIAPSGAYIEQSSNYTRVVLEFLFVFNLFRKTDWNSDFTLYDQGAYLKKLSTYYYDLCYHGKAPNFGDNDDAHVIIPLSNHKVVGATRDCGTNINAYQNTSQWLYKSHDKNDLYLFTRIGTFAYFVEGAFVHAHNDIMSLLMCAKGHEVFIDKGCLFYNSGMEIRKEFTSISAHNLPYIEGIEMTDYLPIGYKNYPRSKTIDYSVTKQGCYFEGEIQYKNVVHTRATSYLNDILTIIDRISLNDNTQSHSLCVPYLLSEKMIPTLGEDEEGWIVLKVEDGTNICKIKIYGVENVDIEDTEYAPHYAYKRKTKKIIGRSYIQNKIEVVTKVIFL